MDKKVYWQDSGDDNNSRLAGRRHPKSTPILAMRLFVPTAFPCYGICPQLRSVPQYLLHIYNEESSRTTNDGHEWVKGYHNARSLVQRLRVLCHLLREHPVVDGSHHYIELHLHLVNSAGGDKYRRVIRVLQQAQLLGNLSGCRTKRWRSHTGTEPCTAPTNTAIRCCTTAATNYYYYYYFIEVTYDSGYVILFLRTQNSIFNKGIVFKIFPLFLIIRIYYKMLYILIFFCLT